MDLLKTKIKAFKELGATDEYINELLQLIETDKSNHLERFTYILKSKFGLTEFPTRDEDFTKGEIQTLINETENQCHTNSKPES